MIERCDDKKCKGFGKQFVDCGYGYPVCPSNVGNLNPIPMKAEYEGKYNKEE